MILTRLNGGLGNQLFQYAMGRRTAHAAGLPLKLDTDKFATCTLRDYRLHHFNIQAPIATADDKRRLRILRRQDPVALLHALLDKLRPHHRRRIIRETTFRFQPALRKISAPAYLDGDWQSPRYFEGAEQEIRHEFTLRSPLDEQNHAAEQTIRNTPNSISVHIRRADLVSDPATRKTHGALPAEYYAHAIRQLTGNLRSPTLFLFSDDPAWAAQNLPAHGLPLRPIDHNGPGKDYADLHLMSQCQHHITANSTFSWWAAWLARHPAKQVLHPTPWFRNSPHDTTDLFPPGWTAVDSPQPDKIT